MAELMVRGAGRRRAVRTGALATQAAWVAHRRRKVAARVALANQVIGQLDLVFPGLDGCFSDLLGARAGRVIVTDICDPTCPAPGSRGPASLRRPTRRRTVGPQGPRSWRRPGWRCACRRGAGRAGQGPGR